MRKLLCLTLTACLLFVLALCAAAEEAEVSLADYFGTTPEPGQTATPEAGASTPVPVYELDGSTVITMTFTGDMTIGENVQYSGKSIFAKELEKQDGDINFIFRNIRDVLQGDDLTVVNFEGTLTTAGRNRDKLENSFLFRAPPEYARVLPDNSVEAVSLENNHVMDMGEEGFAETKRVLGEAGVGYYSEDDPFITELRGVKVGFLAYQTFNNQYPRLYEKVPQDIAALKAEGCVVVVVSYHWGDEEDYAPNDNQQKLGKLTIDSGADLVIGHHSHRINPIEEYNGKYICYSLGNFSFAGNNKPRDMSAYLFQIKLRVKDGVAKSDGFIIIPCRISSRTDYNDFAPTPYTKEQSVESILNVLKRNGQSLDNPVAEYPLRWTIED